MSVCEKSIQWEEALGLLQEMEMGHKLPVPNVVSCNTAISACGKGK